MRGLRKIYQCGTCGVEREVMVSQVGVQFYCSRPCYHASMKGKEPHNKGMAQPARKPCKQCGGEIVGQPSTVARRTFCSSQCAGDHFAQAAGSDLARLERRVAINPLNDCWEWQGPLDGGYGRSKFSDGTKYTHRKMYELKIGPVPDGLVLDHLCRNRACCNPAHLEPVTAGENTRRGVAGYNKPSPETREKISRAQKARYQDEALRMKQRAHLDNIRESEARLPALRDALADPDYRKARSEQMKRIWKERKSEC